MEKIATRTLIADYASVAGALTTLDSGGIRHCSRLCESPRDQFNRKITAAWRCALAIIKRAPLKRGQTGWRSVPMRDPEAHAATRPKKQAVPDEGFRGKLEPAFG
jgi:hypothetical protein